MANIRRAQISKEGAFCADIEGAVRSVLKAAGWKPEEGAGGTIWYNNPIDRHWYDEFRAMAILKEGADPGGSD